MTKKRKSTKKNVDERSTYVPWNASADCLSISASQKYYVLHFLFFALLLKTNRLLFLKVVKGNFIIFAFQEDYIQLMRANNRKCCQRTR